MTTWHGCYDSGWGDLIVPEAYAHPAKMARGLVERIFDRLAELGLPRGSLICDPFGGIGTGGVISASRGYRWIGCDLEEKFCKLAERNFELHKRSWEAFGDPMPRIVQGDSRRLCEALGPVLAECVISSPPFGTGDSGSAQSVNDRTDKSASWVKKNCGSAATKGYGQSPGQLGAMKLGDVGAILSSPPYEGSIDCSPNENTRLADVKGQSIRYSNNGADNMGNSTGETFWTAAFQVVRECHRILKPGGIAVWVVKAFCRKGKIVDFPGDWVKLCKARGFEMVEEIHASLVKEVPEPSMFEVKQTRQIARKSFFRRLHEKKRPDLAIDYEVVLVMRRKPLS